MPTPLSRANSRNTQTHPRTHTTMCLAAARRAEGGQRGDCGRMCTCKLVTGGGWIGSEERSSQLFAFFVFAYGNLWRNGCYSTNANAFGREEKCYNLMRMINQEGPRRKVLHSWLIILHGGTAWHAHAKLFPRAREAIPLPQGQGCAGEAGERHECDTRTHESLYKKSQNRIGYEEMCYNLNFQFFVSAYLMIWRIRGSDS